MGSSIFMIMAGFIVFLLGIVQIVIGAVGFASTKRRPFIVLIVTGGFFILSLVLGILFLLIALSPVLA